jgi:hypothetical protein
MDRSAVQPAGGLPALLAEYGCLTAQLPDSSPAQAGELRTRLAELDAMIDRWVTELGVQGL